MRRALPCPPASPWRGRPSGPALGSWPEGAASADRTRWACLRCLQHTGLNTSRCQAGDMGTEQ